MVNMHAAPYRILKIPGINYRIIIPVVIAQKKPCILSNHVLLTCQQPFRQLKRHRQTDQTMELMKYLHDRSIGWVGRVTVHNLNMLTALMRLVKSGNAGIRHWHAGIFATLSVSGKQTICITGFT